jgi:hypothetical protein
MAMHRGEGSESLPRLRFALNLEPCRIVPELRTRGYDEVRSRVLNYDG